MKTTLAADGYVFYVGVLWAMKVREDRRRENKKTGKGLEDVAWPAPMRVTEEHKVAKCGAAPPWHGHLAYYTHGRDVCTVYACT